MTATAVAERAESQVVDHPATSELAFIERMALNPNIDPEKLERLIAMQKDMAATTSKAAFTSAMVKMRPDLPIIEKKGTSNNGAYGKWEDIQGAIDPVLASHGFALSFKTSSAPNSITVIAILRHEAGHEDSTELTLPADNSGSKNNVQAVGSSVSYGKRYTAGALLNLRIGGEDDDGARGGGALTDDQVDALEELISAAIAENKSDPTKYRSNLLKYMKVETVGAIQSKDFAKAKTAIESTRKK